MVRLILGRSGSGKTTRVLTEIAENARKNEGGQILLVPEQFSFNSERELCALAGNGISRFAEVMTFKSLARRVFSEKGGLSATPLDEGGRLLAMYLAVTKVKAGGSLCLYKNVSARPELMKRLVDTVAEMKENGVKPEDLLPYCDGDGILQEKLRDLTLIYHSYDAVMSGDLKDPADILALLADKLGGGEYFNGRKVYADGFNGFTPAEMRILSIIAAGAESLTVSLCCDGPYQRDGGESVFAHVQNTVRDIERMCRKTGVPCVTDASDIRPKRYKNTDSDLARLERSLFDYAAEPVSSEPDGSVSLCAAPTVYEECELAAARIIALVSEEKLRYRDIAVAVRDLEGYGADISAAFGKYGVPYFIDKRDPISQKTPVIALCAALDACMNRFRCGDVLRLAKTGLAGIDTEEADRLENYALTWNINGPAWTRPEGFNAHPDGFGAVPDKDSDELLERLNDIRLRLIAPLAKLRERTKEDADARALAGAVYEYMVSAGMPEMLGKRAEALKAAGKTKQAAEYQQLWEIFCKALDQCVLILGDSKLPFSEFAPLLKLVLYSYDVGAIPTTLDGVIVGEAGRMRFSRPKALFVLGAADGVFPAKPKESGVFTASEKKRMLEDTGLRLAATDEEQMLREQLNVYQTLSAPSEKLFISYAKAGRDGEPASQSYIITRILKLFPKIKLGTLSGKGYKTYAIAPCIELACEYENQGYRRDALAAAAYRAAAETERGRELIAAARRANAGTRGPMRNPAVISGLYGEEAVITASRIEKYNACRFAFFAQYGLRAKARKPARFEAAQTGSFIHYVLEKTAADVAALGAAAESGENPWKTVTKSAVREFAKKHIEEYAKSALGGLEDKTPRFVYLFGRLRGRVFSMLENMVDEFSVSRFAPVSFERDIGESGQTYFEYGGRKIPLSGRIDRIDLWESGGKKYIRVVDYKSGSKKFDYGDVEYGLGIQLLLYLFALAAEDPDIIPAGVMYIPALSKTVRVDCAKTREKIAEDAAKASRRTGVLLNDMDVILAMENVPEGGKARFIPVSFSGSGKERKPSKNAYLITSEQFNIFREHVGRLLKEMSDEVESGCIECDPYVSAQVCACDSCDYLPVCQFDVNRKTDAYRQLKKISREDFFRDKAEGGEANGVDE